MTTQEIGCFNTESKLIGKDDDLLFIPIVNNNNWETKECIVRPEIKYN